MQSQGRMRLMHVLSAAAFAAAVCGWATQAVAQAPTDVARVEEEWFAVLNEPNNMVESPQFHTTMSPVANLDSFYAQVTWNYRYITDLYGALQYQPGGLQLHSWKGDTELRTRTLSTAILSTAAENIVWTQSLQTDGATLTFDILNGWSTTWGAFGKDMRISADANLPNLNTYSTDVSVKNSWVTYGSNRLTLLMIYEVRRYNAYGQLIATDCEPKVLQIAH